MRGDNNFGCDEWFTPSAPKYKESVITHLLLITRWFWSVDEDFPASRIARIIALICKDRQTPRTVHNAVDEIIRRGWRLRFVSRTNEKRIYGQVGRGICPNQIEGIALTCLSEMVMGWDEMRRETRRPSTAGQEVFIRWPLFLLIRRRRLRIGESIWILVTAAEWMSTRV